jgi:hypothetical protein
MSDTQDLDQVTKALGKLIEDWGKTIADLAKEIEKLQGDSDKKDGKQDDKGGGGSKDAADKAREKLKKEAEDASKELAKKIFDTKIPPQGDQKQGVKLPDILTKNITKNGLKIGDYGSVKPDIDFDPKKMKFKKVVVGWTWEF